MSLPRMFPQTRGISMWPAFRPLWRAAAPAPPLAARPFGPIVVVVVCGVRQPAMFITTHTQHGATLTCARSHHSPWISKSIPTGLVSSQPQFSSTYTTGVAPLTISCHVCCRCTFSEVLPVCQFVRRLASQVSVFETLSLRPVGVQSWEQNAHARFVPENVRLQWIFSVPLIATERLVLSTGRSATVVGGSGMGWYD